MFLTASSACDPEIIDKPDAYLVKGGKAIVTSGFVKATLGRGVERFTSLAGSSPHRGCEGFYGGMPAARL
ncbi:MAG: hypothetical protein ACLUE8_01385 [Lachnospiraceae bacterium]